MPKPPPTFNDRIDKAAARGSVAATHAAGVRKAHRRKSAPGTGKRQKDIAYALTRIDHAMKDVRRAVGRLPWEKHTPSKAAALDEVSKSLQYERKQLKKMQRRHD